MIDIQSKFMKPSLVPIISGASYGEKISGSRLILNKNTSVFVNKYCFLRHICST